MLSPMGDESETTRFSGGLLFFYGKGSIIFNGNSMYTNEERTEERKPESVIRMLRVNYPNTKWKSF